MCRYGQNVLVSDWPSPWFQQFNREVRLRTTKSPVDNMHRIVCDAAELHNRIVSQVLHGWTDVDGETMDALEPLLQDIVRSTQRGGGDFSEMKVVITERYIYNENTHAITSCKQMLKRHIPQLIRKCRHTIILLRA